MSQSRTGRLWGWGMQWYPLQEQEAERCTSCVYEEMGRQVCEKTNVLSPNKNRAWFMGSECTFLA